MPRRGGYRRSSLGFAILLIAIGALWLYGNMHPGFDPWDFFWHYWPVILIAIGVGKLVDYFIDSANANRIASAGTSSASDTSSGHPQGHSHAGEVVAILVVVALVAIAMSRHNLRREWRSSSHSVDVQGAEKADVNINLGAGNLTLRGGAPAGKIVDADFHYALEDGEPSVTYSVSKAEGTLDLDQHVEEHLRLVSTRNDWDIKLNNDIPSSLRVDIGAGHGDLDLRGLTLTGLDLEMGAGQVNADLSANWKKDSTVTIQGGVGQATVRLPEDIGVRVNASGGIGTVSSGGLHREGDAYVNDAYGKSPTTLEVNISGGVGQIRLETEP